jgi:hypothetical protein
MASKGPRIADNPSIAKLQQDVQGAKQLLKLRPLLRLFGVRLDDSLAEKVSELDQSLQELATLPDRFNDLFSERGWIAYEMLKTDVMRQAVELGEAGDLDAAEQLLVEHFDGDTIEWGIKFMWAAKAFHPRERLARLALEDYLQGRYHACVPVQLMIIDGFVNDVSRSKGFFAEGTDLTAWDSIAAHDRGLQTLAKLWGKTRKKTTTEPISVPYRHGILHGRDLGYDNRLVAAKLWAGLFALRAWAIAVRDNRVEEPPSEPQPSLRDSLELYGRVQEQKADLEAWKPRTCEQLAAIPRSGKPEDYEEDSPERALAELMHLWSRKNYGHIARLVHLPLEGPPKDRNIGPIARDLRALLDGKSLVAFEILELQDQAAAATNARVLVRYRQDEEIAEQELELRLLYLDEEGAPVIRGKGRGNWMVLNLWTLT